MKLLLMKIPPPSMKTISVLLMSFVLCFCFCSKNENSLHRLFSDLAHQGSWPKQITKYVNIPGYWKNGAWVALAPLDSNNDSNVFSLFISGSDIYAGGYMSYHYSDKVIGYWKNGVWVNLIPFDLNKQLYFSTTASDSIINTLFISGADVYAGGFSHTKSNTNISGSEVPCYWKNGAWMPLVPIDSTKDSYIKSLVVSGSDIYAIGYNVNNSFVKVPGYWKNSTWIDLTPLDGTKNSFVNYLVLSDSDVYAGGYSTNSSGVSVPGYWKNGTWVGLAPLDSNYDSDVRSLFISGTDVYAGGFSLNTSKVWVPGYWKNGIWIGFTPVDAIIYSSVSSFVISQSDSGVDIYVGGINYNNPDNSNEKIPGYWKNDVWIPLSYDGFENAVVNTLFISGSDIYAGGYAVKSHVEWGIVTIYGWF